MRRDPLILGGGPAGAAAAITLGRAGYRPVVVERLAGPADKVCGDFLGIDTVQRIRALGVDPVALGAEPIGRVRLVHGERTAEATLPFPAFGLSRRTLDDALLNRAGQAGAIVRAGETVRRLTGAPNAWHVQTGGPVELIAETVFLATGKHDLRDRPRPHSAHDAVGMKMYYAAAPGQAARLDDAIELTLFPGGYAGLQRIENGRIALCVAVQQRAFQGHGGSWETLLAAIGRDGGRFSAIMAGLRPLLARPLAVAGVPYGYLAKPVSPAGLFRLGDQAAVIPSLTGDGMAIALHSGMLAADTWLAGGGSEAYRRSLTQTLGSRMRLAGMLHRVCMNGAAQSTATRAAAWFPALLRQAACHTRLPPYAAAGANRVGAP